MTTRVPRLKREIIPTELTEINFDNVTLKQLRSTIDEYIDAYGEEAYIKETCARHDNYSFSVFLNMRESDKDYKARCAAERTRREQQKVRERERDEKEFARLQTKLGIKNT